MHEGEQCTGGAECARGGQYTGDGIVRKAESARLMTGLRQRHNASVQPAAHLVPEAVMLMTASIAETCWRFKASVALTESTVS